MRDSATGSVDWLEMLKEPPAWILAILVTILAGHLLKVALHAHERALIPILETFVVVVVGGLLVHSYLHGTVAPVDVHSEASAMSGNPLTYLGALLGFTVLSIILYLVDRRIPGR